MVTEETATARLGVRAEVEAPWVVVAAWKDWQKVVATAALVVATAVGKAASVGVVSEDAVEKEAAELLAAMKAWGQCCCGRCPVEWGRLTTQRAPWRSC